MNEKAAIHVYNGILLSHNTEWNNAIGSNMNRPRAYHTKPERERQTLYVIPSTWNLKYDTMNLSMK